MQHDDLILAPFERVVEFGNDADVGRDEFARPQRLLGGRGKMNQHQLDAAILRRPLDLGETIGRRRIDSGHQLEVEYQEAAFGMTLEKRLDVLVEPVGRAEKQIALQVEALDLAAMRRQYRLIFARAIERAAIFRAVKAVFDRIDARGAQGKRGAADDDADQDAGDEAPLHDDDDNGEQRQVFDELEPPPRLNDPFVKLVGRQIDQKTAEHEFRHIAEQR